MRRAVYTSGKRARRITLVFWILVFEFNILKHILVSSTKSHHIVLLLGRLIRYVVSAKSMGLLFMCC